jgi:hypothetical protein
MGVFIRAIVTGFGFSLGKALFDKVSERLGLTGNDDTAPEEAAVGEDGELDADDDA